MDVSTESQISSISSQSLQDRFILTQVGHQQLVFPSHFIAEILLIERSQILALPFYSPVILGVVHHLGRIVPLVAIQQILEQTVGLPRETVDVVQLGPETGPLAGVGIVVDRIINSRLREQLPDALWAAPSQPVQSSTGETLSLFRSDLLSDRVWVPYR